MKKHGLLKVLGISVLVLLILTWIIPTSQFSGTAMSKVGLTRLGFFDLFNYPLQSFQYFIQMILFVLVVGGFYAILNKTGKYNEMIELLAKKLKGKENIFLVAVAFLFAGLSSVFGFSVLLFVFIPMLVSIILLLGYDKVVALLVTCVSVLVGVIGSTFNLYTIGYLNQVLSTEFSDLIIAKIFIFVIVFLLYIAFTLKYVSKVKKSSKNSVLDEKTEDVFFIKEEIVSEVKKEDTTTKTKGKKGSKAKKVAAVKTKKEIKKTTNPIVKKVFVIALISLAVLFGLSFLFKLFLPKFVCYVIRIVVICLALLELIAYNILFAKRSNFIFIAEIFILLFAIVFIGCTPWSDTFSIKAFTNLNETITTAKIGSYTVWTFILGEIGELGTWYYGEITIILIVASIILGLIYKIKLDEFIDTFAEGMKKVLAPAVVMTLAMVVVVISVYHPVFPTICKTLIGWSDKFGIIPVFITSFLAIIGSFLNVEMVYMAQSIVGYFGMLFADAKPALVVIFNAMYGLTMLVAPTSLMLILGLEYLNIPYGKWLKFSWKMLVELLVVLLVIFVIITLV